MRRVNEPGSYVIVVAVVSLYFWARFEKITLISMELFGVSGSCHAEICGTEIIRLSIVQVDTVMKKLKLKLCV